MTSWGRQARGSQAVSLMLFIGCLPPLTCPLHGRIQTKQSASCSSAECC